jgi:hypothetical protein
MPASWLVREGFEYVTDAADGKALVVTVTGPQQTTEDMTILPMS